MMRRAKTFLKGRAAWWLVLLFGVTSTVPAAEFPLVTEALAKMELSSMQDYAYTQTSDNKGKLTIEKYDPSFPGELKWQLLLQEGEEPSERDLRKYEREKLKELKRRQGEEEFRYTAFIDRETLVLVEDGPRIASFSFQPAEGSTGRHPFSGMMKELQGFMRIDKEQKYIEFLQITNREVFSPIIGVRVDRFNMEMIFAPQPRSEVVLLRESLFSFAGKALLLKELEENILVTYTDFQYRGKPSG